MLGAIAALLDRGPIDLLKAKGAECMQGQKFEPVAVVLASPQKLVKGRPLVSVLVRSVAAPGLRLHPLAHLFSEPPS